MKTDVLYESIDGKRGVRIEKIGEFMQFLTMRNGYQWSGMPVDRELLLRMRAAIESALPDAFGVLVGAKPLGKSCGEWQCRGSQEECSKAGKCLNAAGVKENDHG